MITIQLTNAENGVIKKVIDTQYNGADQSAEIIKLYEFDEEDKIEYFVKLTSLLSDVANDLGIDFGSVYESNKLVFDIEWGEKYQPSKEEIDEKIKMYKNEIKSLNEYKKNLENNVDNL